MENMEKSWTVGEKPIKVEHDKMYAELGMLQEKIVALEAKLKSSNCIGLDYRTDAMNIIEKYEKNEPNNDKICSLNNSYCLPQPKALANTEEIKNQRFSKTPITNTRYNNLGSEKNNENSNLKYEKPFHTHTNSTYKDIHEKLRNNRSFSNLPKEISKESPAKNLIKSIHKEISATKLTEKTQNFLTRKSAEKPKTSIPSKKPISQISQKSDKENSENCNNQSSLLKATAASELKKVKNPSKTQLKPKTAHPVKQNSPKNANENWKQKYEKLKAQNEKLQTDFHELAENYKMSEQLRKQQRKHIRELEKKLKAVTTVSQINSSVNESLEIKPAPQISVNIKKKSNK